MKVILRARTISPLGTRRYDTNMVDLPTWRLVEVIVLARVLSFIFVFMNIKTKRSNYVDCMVRGGFIGHNKPFVNVCHSLFYVCICL